MKRTPIPQDAVSRPRLILCMLHDGRDKMQAVDAVSVPLGRCFGVSGGRGVSSFAAVPGASLWSGFWAKNRGSKASASVWPVLPWITRKWALTRAAWAALRPELCEDNFKTFCDMYNEISTAIRAAVRRGGRAVWSHGGRSLSVGRGLDGLSVSLYAGGVLLRFCSGLTLIEAVRLASELMQENFI